MNAIQDTTSLPSRFTFERPSWAQIVAAALILVFAWSVWSPTIRQLVARNAEWLETSDELFDNGTVTPPQRVEVVGFHPCSDGFCLGPRATGQLIYTFVAKHSHPILNLWFFPPSRWTSQVAISLDQGKSYRRLDIGTPTLPRMSRVVLPAPVEAGQDVKIRFTATNQDRETVFVLDRCRIIYRDGAVPELPSDVAVFAMVVSFGLAAVALTRRRAETLATVLILALGAAFRYLALIEVADQPLDPDARWYRIFAESMALFTKTGFFSAQFDMREPFFIFVAHLYYKLFGPSDVGIRLLTVILSVLSIWVVMRVGRHLFGRIPGQLIGLALAINTVLALESPRGLRLELEIVLFAIYLGLAFVKHWSRVVPAAVALSVVGVLLVLTRWSYLIPVLALNAYVLFRPRDLKASLAGMIVTIAIIAAGVVPHRYNMYRLHNDAFYDMTMYAKWIANNEFGGQPGFRSREESMRDPFGGPNISYSHYMFGLHTKREIVVGTVRGYWKLYRAMVISPWFLIESRLARARIDKVFQAFAALGLILALWLPKYRWIPLTFVIVEFPVSFLYDRLLVEPYRHSYSSFPLVLFAATLPLGIAWNQMNLMRCAANTTILSRSTPWLQRWMLVSPYVRSR